MGTAFAEIDMEVFLVLCKRKSIDAGCCPRVLFAVDVNHLRVVLAQETDSVLVEFRRELYVLRVGRQHETLEISFGCLDAQIFLEWLGVVAIVSQFTGSLDIEGNIGRLVCEITWLADSHQIDIRRSARQSLLW